MELEELYEKLNGAYQEYEQGLSKVEERRNDLISQGYKDEVVDKNVSELKSKIEGNFEDKTIKSLKMLKESAQVKINNLQQELQPSENYEKRQYELTRAKGIIDLLEDEDIPAFLEQTDNDIQRQEYIRLAKAKVKDPALEKQLGQKLLAGLNEEERQKREELAYNQALLEHKDSIDNKAFTGITKAMNSSLGQANREQFITNAILHIEKKKKAINNNLDMYILNQY